MHPLSIPYSSLVYPRLCTLNVDLPFQETFELSSLIEKDNQKETIITIAAGFTRNIHIAWFWLDDKLGFVMQNRKILSYYRTRNHSFVPDDLNDPS